MTKVWEPELVSSPWLSTWVSLTVNKGRYVSSTFSSPQIMTGWRLKSKADAHLHALWWKELNRNPCFSLTDWELTGHCGVQGWELVWRFPMVTATMEIIFFSGAFKDLEPGFNHSLKENKGRTWTGIAFLLFFFFFIWRFKRFPTGVFGGWARAPKAAAMSKGSISKWPSREQDEPSWPWGKLTLSGPRQK